MKKCLFYSTGAVLFVVDVLAYNIIGVSETPGMYSVIAAFLISTLLYAAAGCFYYNRRKFQRAAKHSHLSSIAVSINKR